MARSRAAGPIAPPPVREERREVVVPVSTEAVAREDRAPEPPARTEAQAPPSQSVPQEAVDRPRPEPATVRPVAVEVVAKAEPPAEPDRPVSPRPASHPPPEAREAPSVPQTHEAPRQADAPRPAALEVTRDPPPAPPVLQPRPVERPWIATPRAAAPSSEPPVEIRIGRIEVRAPRAPDPAPAPPPERGFADLALARRGLERRWY